MDVERIIDEIEQLQEMFEAPDIRPLSPSDLAAVNRRHDEMLAHSPWFRLWQQYGFAAEVKQRAGFGWRARVAFCARSNMFSLCPSLRPLLDAAGFAVPLLSSRLFSTQE
jgi:hypothetical protein